MKKLAQATVEYILLLSTTSEDYIDPRLMEKNLVPLLDELREASDEEKSALADAARSILAFMTPEPDEYGYTPRGRVSQEEKDILGAIGDGSLFRGA
jgi:hypothetical protein